MEAIRKWLEQKMKWLETTKVKDKSLTGLLQDELRKSVERDESVYTEALKARTFKETDKALRDLYEARKKADAEDNEPRKKGFLEVRFDAALDEYIEQPTNVSQDFVLEYISQLEINRRVRFLYDLQKLRIGANNRRESNHRNFGVNDIYLDYSGEVLHRLETYNIKMIDRVIGNSVDGEFYAWLKENHLGVGPQMAACIISELSCPDRFHSVSSLWAYCGLHVVGNNSEGYGGHAARRETGKLANWNSFLKTKLLGVLTGTMIKTQTKYIGTGEEKTRGKNVSCLNGYKSRITHRNNMIPEEHRYYTNKGKEIFTNRSTKEVEVFDKDGNSKGKMAPDKMQRRTPAHINDMAKRYMIKMFLCDVLNKWREFKGLEAFLTYDEAKLRNGVRHLENHPSV